jgi:polar amino acid transport system substrate-binding protein
MPSPQQAAALDPTISAILARGYLIVGVSADTRQLGARNPLTNQIEGFDIDMAKAVAQALFGDPNRVRLLVISAGDRIPSLRSAEVDMVARAMTMTCERWQQVSFSSEYYAAGQKVLVGWNPAAGAPRPSTSLADLVGHRVCATAKTSSLERLHSYPGVKVVVGSSHTDCLVKFQQGEADAITGDDTVLAGLATQDPYAVITSAPAISSEPYGLAVAKERTYFAAYLNGVLEQVRADGRWQASYQTWLEPTLGPSVGPPTPVYGRG